MMTNEDYGWDAAGLGHVEREREGMPIFKDTVLMELLLFLLPRAASKLSFVYLYCVLAFWYDTI